MLLVLAPRQALEKSLTPQQLPTPSTLLSGLPVSELSQVEAPAQQLPTPSTLLSGLPVSEPSQKAVFSINSSEQAIDSKNKSWIWAGISTGLASAVALSTGISTLADKPVGDVSKSNSSKQSLSKSDSSAKNARDQGSVTPNNANPNSPRTQAINEPLTVGSPTALNRGRSVREQPSSLARERQVIAATANPPVEQNNLTKTKDTSTEKLAEITAIAKLSAEKRKLNKASEALLVKLRLLEAIAATAKSSAEKYKPNKASKDISAEQPKVKLMATTINLSNEKPQLIATPANRSTEGESGVMETRIDSSTDNQKELMTPAINPPTQEEPRSPEREVLLARLQARLAHPANKSAQELETSPDFEDEPAQEQEQVALPSTKEQEEQIATPVAPPTPQQSERSPQREVLLARLQAGLASSSVSAEELETSLEPAEEQEQVTLPLEESAEAQHFSESLPETSQTSGVPISSESSPNSQIHSALPSDSKNTHSSVISPDGQFLVGISTNNTIKIWNMHTGEILSTLKGHSSQVQSVAISSDGQTLVSVDADNTIKNWNLHTGELLNTSTDILK